MHYSILIPTRNRPQLFSDLIESIAKNTIWKSKIEILVAYDLDDKITHKLALKIPSDYPLISIKFFSRERSVSINKDYYNWLAEKAIGKYLIASNDDCLFNTNGWDILAFPHLEAFVQSNKDGVLYGVTEDDEKEPDRKKEKHFSCFPLISKVAVNALGFFFDPEFYRDGADWAIYTPFHNIGRVIELRKYITIQHISARSKRRKWDELDKYTVEISKTLKYPGINDFVERDTVRLVSYIKNWGKIHNTTVR